MARAANTQLRKRQKTSSLTSAPIYAANVMPEGRMLQAIMTFPLIINWMTIWKTILSFRNHLKAPIDVDSGGKMVLKRNVIRNIQDGKEMAIGTGPCYGP